MSDDLDVCEARIQAGQTLHDSLSLSLSFLHFNPSLRTQSEAEKMQNKRFGIIWPYIIWLVVLYLPLSEQYESQLGL